MKIVNLGYILDMNLDDIKCDINERNFRDLNSKCKAVHAYTNERSKMQCIIIEVKPEQYTYIRNNKYRLCTGSQFLRVFDDLNIKLYAKCGNLATAPKKCENKETCIICAKGHMAKDCDSKETEKCVNGSYSNTTYKTTFVVIHMACDTISREMKKIIIKKIVEPTDYPLLSTVPSHFGRVVPQQNPSVAENQAAAVSSPAIVKTHLLAIKSALNPPSAIQQANARKSARRTEAFKSLER